MMSPDRHYQRGRLIYTLLATGLISAFVLGVTLRHHDDVGVQAFTTNTVPKGVGNASLGDSLWTDDGSTTKYNTNAFTVTAAGTGAFSGALTAGKLSAQAHILTTGTALTNGSLSSCGTGSPTVATGSTDVAGTLTEGTLATGCVLTFAATYTNVPFCTCSSNSIVPFLVGCVSTATTLTFANTSATGDVISYVCVAPTGST